MFYMILIYISKFLIEIVLGILFVYIEVFGLYFFVPAEGISVSPCAKWNTAGITVIGTNSPGNGSNQLNLPQGIFLHREMNALYVADTNNRRVQRVSLDQSSMIGVTVASNIDSMSAIYVDDDETIYVALRYENRVEKWIKGASSGEQIGGQCKQCAGVWLDKEKNVYMAESGTHSVLKWSPGTNTTETIAGRIDELGQTTEHLYFPTGIYINRLNDALYIADMMNSRIQKWNKNATEGITVAGSKDGISGYDASKLASPLDVWVDEELDVIYIVDSDNERIQRWVPNGLIGTTIAGGEGNYRDL
jgi:DNA-binding beta-propeller fold protein YncE